MLSHAVFFFLPSHERIKKLNKGKFMASKILVADDSPTQLKLILAPLRAQDYQVVTASDGEEALKMAFSEHPDLIILDVVMPNMDGFQACRKIKHTDELKHIPVIMLTSKNQKTDEFWGKKQGADEYLTKPFEEKELLETVARKLA
jgi:twitching motility two-component system response regulator PilH